MLDLPRALAAPVRLLLMFALPLMVAGCVTAEGQAPRVHLAATGSTSAAAAAEFSATAPALPTAPSAQARIEPPEDVGRPDAKGVRIVFATGADHPFASRARTLEQAMTAMLVASGYEVISPPDRLRPADNIYLLAADLRISTPKAGGEHVQIDWFVEDASGEPVGRISQKRRMKAGAGAGDWNRQMVLAAAAAAEGVGALVRARAP